MRTSVRLLRKIIVALIGFPLLIIGLILIPVPGPGGLPITLLALLILSYEFEWARKQAANIKGKFREMYEKAMARAEEIEKRADKSKK